jgi:hypothetical protein
MPIWRYRVSILLCRGDGFLDRISPVIICRRRRRRRSGKREGGEGAVRGFACFSFSVCLTCRSDLFGLKLLLFARSFCFFDSRSYGDAWSRRIARTDTEQTEDRERKKSSSNGNSCNYRFSLNSNKLGKLLPEQRWGIIFLTPGDHRLTLDLNN